MQEGPFQASDGFRLYERRWPCAGFPSGAVVIVHGYGHHSGSFAKVAEFLNSRDYEVYAFDQRGFGKAKGRRGTIPSFDQTVEDLGTYLEYIAPDLGEHPMFLMGHSYGCLILAHFIARHQPSARGVVFSSPFLKVPDDVPASLQRLARVIDRFAPWWPVAKVSLEGITRDPQALEASINDPLCFYGRIRAHTGVQMADACAKVQSEFGRITLPFIALHGTADKLADPKGSEWLYERAQSKDKTIKRFDGGYHELFNDLDKGRFLDEVVRWLDAHR